MRQAVLDYISEPLTPAEEAAVSLAMQLQEAEKRYAVLHAACVSTIGEVNHGPDN